MTASPSDGLDFEALSRKLESSGLVRTLHVLHSIDSTNAFLQSLPAERAQHGTLAVADHQARGRGRHDRPWCDRPGQSLLFSILLDAPRPAGCRPLLSLGAAVSVCRVLEREGVEPVRIRWPNDVMIGERKVCGILAETAASPDALVLGVGLNVHQRAEDFPETLRDSATSLWLARPAPRRREDLLAAFVRDFEGVYDLWRTEKDAPLLDDCRRRTATLGRSVFLHSRGRRIDGVAMGLDSDGSLVVRESSGVVSRWHSGDVELLR